MAARHIRTLYETAAVRLVKDDGEIVGVIAERRGKTTAIKANRAVVPRLRAALRTTRR